jgi:phosphoenolpyruvate---glycerone phosphotransferase subunit DhaL
MEHNGKASQFWFRKEVIVMSLRSSTQLSTPILRKVTMSISRDAILNWIKVCTEAIATNKEYLTQLDAAIGDADHGANINRGFQAVMLKLASVADKDIGSVLKFVGLTLVSSTGGAGGPLYGAFFMQMGTVTPGKLELTPTDWATALEAGVNGIILRGKANLGDKTMVDTLIPAVESYKVSVATGCDLNSALNASAGAAEQGMVGTIPLVARKGRASYLGERSVGHQDPGATSANLIIRAAADSLCIK